MKLLVRYSFTASLLLLGAFHVWADDATDQEPVTTATVKPVLTPQMTPTPGRLKPLNNPNGTKALIIHKPMPSPSWGKVVQYHQDQIFALSEKNREILHEFVFQDEDGIIRTATFHENSSGDGYWEVWVWDQQ
jgi:hypothetical protein